MNYDQENIEEEKIIKEEESDDEEENDKEDAGNFEYKKIIQSTGPPCHCQENIDDFKDGLIITTVTTTTIVIVYALRAVDVGQLKALLISTMVTYLLPFPT